MCIKKSFIIFSNIISKRMALNPVSKHFCKLENSSKSRKIIYRQNNNNECVVAIPIALFTISTPCQS